MSETDHPLRKPRRNREWSFQAWADRLIDRIVLQPMFTSGIDHAGQTTDNARARMAARGIKFGLPDIFVAQSPGCVSAWIELKRGSGLSATQEGVHVAMRAAGQHVYVCNTLQQIVTSLRQAGFLLHSNADRLASEFEARLAAKETAPRTTRVRSSRLRGMMKATLSQLRAFRRAGGMA